MWCGRILRLDCRPRHCGYCAKKLRFFVMPSRFAANDQLRVRLLEACQRSQIAVL
jgi:hypothetical protein